ncbi:OLC1v1024690C1 [Oldenlandia corymbosa var. corymbosa]|uniref:OLC1v1024690C1 n=1 Tax=Oldenlandia corymbosa var. corymbosa TaxID=529605 RepID=A0AAV1C323_OLDCO|nr:OLC1v1024690C1 [Oldenlandia corymbosa var. corymbosa]
MIGQDPQPISSEDSVKKFETRMTPIHLFQLITEINKPTDLTEEPDAVDYRQLQRQAIRDMGFGALLNLKIKNIPTALCSFLANNLQTGVRQVSLNGKNVLDIKQEDVVAVLDLPRGPKPVEEFKQNDPAITDHTEMVDAFKKRMGYINKYLPTTSTAAQLIAGRKDIGDEFKRDFLVFVVSTFLHGNTTSRITMNILKSLVNMNEDLAALYEKFYQLIITMSKTVLDIREKEMELKIEPDEQAKQTIKILTDAMVSMSRKMPPPLGTTQHQQEQQQDQQDLQDAQICELCEMAWKAAESSGEIRAYFKKSEQQTQPQAHGTNISTTEKKRSHQDFTGGDLGVTSTYTRRSRSTGTRKRKVFKDPTIPHFNLGIFSIQEDSYEPTQEKNTEEDITGSVDLDKDVNETIGAKEYPVPSALDETKNPTPSIDEIIRRVRAPASKSLSDTKKLEMIAAAAEEVENNSKVVEAIPLSIIPPDWNIASTTGGLLMLEKNECTTQPPTISKEADELDEELTKTVEKSPFMLQKKNKKKFIRWTKEKKKMIQEEALLIEFALLQRQEEIVKSGKLLFEFEKIVWADRTAFYSMRKGTWIENSIIDAWAVILNKEEAKSDSPRRIFFGVSSFDTISRYYQQGSNKEEIKFTFYERLGLELEEQGLTVASMLAAKAIYFPVHYQDYYFLYVLPVEEKKVLVLNNIHAKDLNYYNPTKDLLFRFFKSYVSCVFPRIELVSAQYTFTEVMLPLHKDKTPNVEDCGIYTMHHMERYDGGEYEDGTSLDFNTGNIKEYRWKYMIKIIMHPANKNKDKILEAMHQFYTNTAEEEQKKNSRSC